MRISILIRLIAVMVPLFVIGGPAVCAQSNFAFWLGGTGLYYEGTAINWGTSVGATAKFNVLDYTLVRMQFNVDRVQHGVQFPDFQGTQTNTYVGFGIGPELAIGTRDFNAFIHIVPKGIVRSVSRILTEDDGRVRLWNLRRFSLGATIGVGFEAYVTDNIGFEMEEQYEIFNLDHSDVDPIARGLRSLIGVQFYLGRNYAR